MSSFGMCAALASPVLRLAFMLVATAATFVLFSQPASSFPRYFGSSENWEVVSESVDIKFKDGNNVPASACTLRTRESFGIDGPITLSFTSVGGSTVWIEMNVHLQLASNFQERLFQMRLGERTIEAYFLGAKKLTERNVLVTGSLFDLEPFAGEFAASSSLSVIANRTIIAEIKIPNAKRVLGLLRQCFQITSAKYSRQQFGEPIFADAVAAAAPTIRVIPRNASRAIPDRARDGEDVIDGQNVAPRRGFWIEHVR